MPALSYVGVARANANTSTNSVSTPARSFTTGNHVVVFVRWESTTTTVTLSDTAGNTYTALGIVGSSLVFGRMFYCLNMTGNASNVITATFGANRTFKSIAAIEISGDAPAAVLSASKATTGTSAKIDDPGLTFGENSFLVTGGGNYAADSTRTISDLKSGSWTAVGDSAFAYSQIGYSERPTGSKGLISTFDGNSTSGRIMQTLVLDTEVNTPTDFDTNGRITQMATEVLMTNTAPNLRVSQMAVEILRPNSGPPGPSEVPPLIFTAG
jgi:hypothetical protein